MQHPLLTTLFDMFLIGSATAIVAALVAEHLRSRGPAVGARRSRACARARVSPGRAAVGHRPMAIRTMRRAA